MKWSLTEWISNIAGIIAIAVFLGLGATAPNALHYDLAFTKWIVYAIVVFLAVLNSRRLLSLARSFTKWSYRKLVRLQIEYPQVGETVSDNYIVVRGTYRLKPDSKSVIIFHKAKEGYYPQEPIDTGTGDDRWSAGVTIGSEAHANYTIVVAQCSEDILAIVRYFQALQNRTVKGNSIGSQAFEIPDDLPGFCKLATTRVKYIPRVIDGGTF